MDPRLTSKTPTRLPCADPASSEADDQNRIEAEATELLPERTSEVDPLESTDSIFQEKSTEPNIIESLKPMSTWCRILISVDKFWVAEIFACVFSLACLIGIIVLLSKYSGNPVPRLSLDLGLNTWVSILSTGLKTSMIYAVSQGLSQHKWDWLTATRPVSDLAVFDQASRGPWGALQLFFTWNLAYVAKLGAVITCVALAVDPFAQAVVSYKICSQIDNTQIASIKHLLRTNNATDAAFNHTMARILITNLVRMTDPIYPATGFSCPSTNCSFAIEHGYYQSLAITHECVDITDQAIVTSHNASIANSTNDFTYSIGSGNGSGNISVGYCDKYPVKTIIRSLDAEGYPLPNDAIFELTTVMLKGTMRPYPEGLNVSWSQGSSGRAVSIDTDPTRPGAEIRMSWPAHDGTCTGSKDASFDEPHVAARCSFRPSILTLNTTVESGKAITSQTALTHMNKTRVKNLAPGNLARNLTYFEYADYIGIPEYARTDGFSSYCFNTSTRDIDFTVQVMLLNSSEKVVAWYPQECVFHLNAWSADKLTETARALFGSGDYIGSGNYTPVYEPHNLSASIDYPGGGYTIASGVESIHLSALWNMGNVTYGDVDRYAGRLAEAMTALLQEQSPADDNPPVRGYTELITTCAVVRWSWIALPAILVFLSIVFLVSVIITNTLARKSSKDEWPGLHKSSFLSLLYLKPRSDNTIHYTGELDPTMMYEVARHARSPMERRGQKEE